MNVQMAFLSPSPMELMVIAVIALIVLGPARLPEAARSLGKGMREMRASFSGERDEDDDEDGPGGSEPPDHEPEDGGHDDASFEELEHGAPADDDSPEHPGTPADRTPAGSPTS